VAAELQARDEQAPSRSPSPPPADPRSARGPGAALLVRAVVAAGEVPRSQRAFIFDDPRPPPPPYRPPSAGYLSTLGASGQLALSSPILLAIYYT